MFTIKWDDSIVTGIALVDEDHKKLVTILNNLFAACFAEQGPAVLDGVIKELLDYTQYHFNREEELLEAAGYDSLEKHKAEHRRFIAKLEEITAERANGATHNLSNDTLGFLQTWLVDHIKSEDQEFAKVLRP